VVLPDATILLDYMQHLGSRVAREMTVHADRMRENLELTHGAIHSQRALTSLVESGMDRDAAYRIVQEAAQRAWDEGTSFRDLLAEQLTTHPAAPGVEEEEAAGIDLDSVFDAGTYLAHVPEILERLERLRN
jgi:adenylosuccinate lyase